MIFLAAGHSSVKGTENTDPGAIANGHTEADLAVVLRDLTRVAILKKGGKVTTDDDRKSLKQVIQAFSISKDGDIICDIHFNAATPKATGVEVFHPARASQEELDLAMIIAKRFSDTMGIKNRGIKDETQSARKRLGIMNPKGVNVLIEVCFITNPSDLNAFLETKEQLGDILAELLLNADAKTKTENDF